MEVLRVFLVLIIDHNKTYLSSYLRNPVDMLFSSIPTSSSIVFFISLYMYIEIQEIVQNMELD